MKFRQLRKFPRKVQKVVLQFLLNAYKKTEERDKLRNKLLSRKESELEDLKYSQPNHIAKNEKGCSAENTKSVDEQPFDKETMDVIHGLNQPFQQKPGIEVELYWKNYQFEVKERDSKQHGMKKG